MSSEARRVEIDRELARVRAALPPVGARVLLAEVARRAELEEAVTLRRLAVLCAGNEAALDGDWVERRAAREGEA